MLNADLTTGECNGRAVAALRGELGVADAADVAAHQCGAIIDWAGLEFIDSSGVTALVCAYENMLRAPGAVWGTPAHGGGGPCLLLPFVQLRGRYQGPASGIWARKLVPGGAPCR
jgi:hypothetical protein